MKRIKGTLRFLDERGIKESWIKTMVNKGDALGSYIIILSISVTN